MIVVLDKSWVFGAAAEIVSRTAEEHRLLMPEVLLYELLTTARDQQIRCFQRLSRVQRSIWLIGGVGELLRHEIDTRTAARPLSELCLSKDLAFHPDAGSTGYKFTDAQLKVIEAEKASREGTDLDGFIDQCVSVGGWSALAGLKSVSAGSPKESVASYVNEVANNPECVRAIYGALHDQSRRVRDYTMPPPEIIGSDWALFRWTQVKLLGAIEFVRRYGTGKSDSPPAKLPNFYLDQAYLITALLADGLASCDAEMGEFYKCLAPEATLIGCRS